MSYNFFFDCLFILEFMYTFIRKVNSSSVHVTKKNLASDLSWKTFCVLKSSQNRDWQPIYTRVSAITISPWSLKPEKTVKTDRDKSATVLPPEGAGSQTTVASDVSDREWNHTGPPFQKPLSWGREKKARHNKIHWFYSLLICIIKKIANIFIHI